VPEGAFFGLKVMGKDQPAPEKGSAVLLRNVQGSAGSHREKERENCFVESPCERQFDNFGGMSQKGRKRINKGEPRKKEES